MHAKSAYLKGALADHVFGGPDFTRPATVYLALYSDTAFTELSGNGYARAAVTNNATNFPAASGGVKTNGAAITFAAATGNWPQAVAWAICDAGSGGNRLYQGALTPPVTVQSGYTARFAAGALAITEADN